MKRSVSILPFLAQILAGFGENLRFARLRRRYSAETVAQRAGIARATLYRVERGDPRVSFGIYARVMQALRLEEDLKSLAIDDVLGRKLQDLGLEVRARSPKKNMNPNC
jgi:transcriptional regulator with XRE-family HTH domain